MSRPSVNMPIKSHTQSNLTGVNMRIEDERLGNRNALHADIARFIEEGFGTFTRKKAEVLMAIALFDSLNLAARFGSSSTAMWMIRSLSLPNSSAHEYVKVARTLDTFSRLADAFLEGRLNYSKVRLLLPHLTAATEEELVELAVGMTYHELELALLKFRSGDGPRGRKSYVRLKARDDGRIGLWADFNAAEGARVMAALKVGELAWHDVDWDELEGGDGALDEAKVDSEIDRRTRSSSGCSGFGLPLGEALLSAFMGIVNIALTQPRNPLRSPGAHVNIVMTTDGRAYLPNNPGAPSAAVENFLSNASYRVNRVDSEGLLLNTGRSFRLANESQVNALMLMWRGTCAMPGCTHTRFMEMHHIHEWADGGPTDLENLLPLCSACHSMVSDGFVKILKDSGDIHFVFPDGSRFVSRDRGLPVRNDNALTLHEFNEAEWA